MIDCEVFLSESVSEAYLTEAPGGGWLVRVAFWDCVHTLAQFNNRAEAEDYLAAVNAALPDAR